jgi:hypothetical protein
MTYDQFWNQDVELAKFYRQADKIKQERRNYDLWLQGAYTYEALLDAAPVLRFSFSKKPIKPVPYRDLPFELGAEKREQKATETRKATKEERQDQKAKTMMEMFMLSFNKRFEKKDGEGNG